jgi:hypothetical protein
MCGLSSGNGFSTATLWSSAFSDNSGWGTTPSYWATIRFPDVDGDGRADVCARGIAGILCARSTGSGFGPITLWDPNPSDAAGWGARQYWATIQFPDVDGDGRSDMCARAFSE